MMLFKLIITFYIQWMGLYITWSDKIFVKIKLKIQKSAPKWMGYYFGNVEKHDWASSHYYNKPAEYSECSWIFFFFFQKLVQQDNDAGKVHQQPIC